MGVGGDYSREAINQVTAVICMRKYGNLQLLKLQLPLQQSHLHLNQTKTVVKFGPVQGCCCTVFQLDLNDTERSLLNFFQDLMAKIIKDTPEEPVPFLIKVLKKMYAEGSSKVQLFLFVSFNLLSINYSILQMLDDMFLLLNF